MYVLIVLHQTLLFSNLCMKKWSCWGEELRLADGGCVLGMSVQWGWGNFHQPRDRFIQNKSITWPELCIHGRERPMVLSICLDLFCILLEEYTPTAVPIDSLGLLDTYTY
jgi:hypothetical protein